MGQVLVLELMSPVLYLQNFTLVRKQIVSKEIMPRPNHLNVEGVLFKKVFELYGT